MKRRLDCVQGIVALFCAAFAAAALAQEVPLDEGGFTEFAAAKLRAAMPDVSVSVDAPLTLSLSIDGLKVHLDRPYDFCKQQAAQCTAALENYARGVAQVVKQSKAPVDRAAVRLMVRSAQYLQRAQAMLGKDAPALQVRPLADGLFVVAVLDTPRATRPLDERDLKALGLTTEALMALGRDNLAANLKPLADVAKPVAAGQIGTVRGDVFETGRLAMPESWAALAEAQGGTLLVSAPVGDMVLYISEATPVAIDALHTLSTKAFSSSQYPLSNAVLRWTPGGWQAVGAQP